MSSYLLGKIPLGYKYQVQQNSESVHGIPEPSEFDEIEYDWKKIRSDIHHFLRVFLTLFCFYILNEYRLIGVLVI